MAHHFLVQSLLDTYGPPLETASLRVVPKLREFMEALTTAMPGVRFLFKRGSEAYVYRENTELAMGYIGYGDYSGGYKFMVYARGITNNKFSPGGTQHNMLMSGNLAVAVKHAKTHLRPYSIAEVAQQGWDRAHRVITEAVMKPFGGMYKVESEVRESGALLRELQHLVALNHTFLDPTYSTKVARWVALRNAREALANGVRRYVFARISEDWRGEVLQLQSMGEVRGDYFRGATFDPKDASTMPMAEVDPLVIGRISVLSMVPTGTFVDGVGYRSGEKAFYVEV